ncbi:MAG: DNA topoisomerase IV subunit B, partial [Malacoplasma sp.]|nr:DNA topoisomerase IV subunit B [Malacoplasma sp.]
MANKNETKLSEEEVINNDSGLIVEEEEHMLEEEQEYNASSIQVLKGLEAVRVRPGMYIGSTGSSGLHHMIWEIIDNSIDEIAAGYGNNITVTLSKEGTIKVEDDGRGIPVEIHKEEGKPTVEVVLTILHAGGKFDNNAYKTSGGLHGVGASVVNALSQWMKVWVVRNHQQYYIEFKDGGQVAVPLREEGRVDKMQGTTVEFYPDYTVMEKAPFEHEKIEARLRKVAYLNKNAHIKFVDEQLSTTQEFHYPEGLVAYVRDINANKTPLFQQVVYAEKQLQIRSATKHDPTDPDKMLLINVQVDLAFQYNTGYNPAIYAFCNNIDTTDGGTHEEGFKQAVLKVLNNFAIRLKLLKEDEEKFSKDDVLEGLTAIVSVKHPDPQYDGQTKTRLGNTELRPAVNQVTTSVFERFMNENPDVAKLLVEKVKSAREARIKSQAAREAVRRKSPFEGGGLPGKLADCTTKDNSISELYLVEGDSAGGSAKLGRDRFYQAILPL